MNWEDVAQYLDLALGVVLVARLLALHLHRVYRIFCAFLIADLSGSVIWIVKVHSPWLHFDYRIAWILGRAVAWVLTLWTVYSLLDAILAKLPGILRFSRKLLNISFAIALGLGVLSAVPEYSAAGTLPGNGIAHLVDMGFILDRVLATAALLVLIAVLLFFSWFPIEMSRNLAIFSAGFVVYFAAKTALLLSRTFSSYETMRVVSPMVATVLSACLAYWAIFISAAGEHVRTRYGHIWEHKKQERLMGQIEAINASLLRAARR